MDRKVLFNDGWEFVKTPIETPLEKLGEYEAQFSPVDIPHDWLIWNTQDLYETSTGWYRKHFTVDADQVTLLRFDGVYMDSRVYVNGQFAGEWKYGYSAFEFDITAFVKQGDNEVCVRVDHHNPNSRWYSGAGIFRDVWLKSVPAYHLVSDGIYVHTAKRGDDYCLEVEAEAAKDGVLIAKGHSATAVLCTGNGEKVATFALAPVDEKEIFYGEALIEKPLLWDDENPNLYTLTVTLDNGDTDSTVVGFRTFEYSPEKGFLCNGRKVKWHGVCEHHDLGALGAAFNKEAMRRKMTMLKAMGVNAIRTSHNMPAEGLMELADELGFFIDSESFDMWQIQMTEYDYHRFFDEWCERDVASWVRRDRNHPSVVMWSIGNEIPDTNYESGLEITKMLKGYVEQHDHKLNARVTIGSNYMPWEYAQKCADVYKLAGYNYAEIHYDAHHEKYPDWMIYGSETSSVVQSRGVYHFPFEETILTEEDEQCSALGNSRPSWAAKSVEACIIADRDRDFAAGQFLWTGFDYIGEPTPYKTKNAYYGQVDTAGFPKDSYFMYRAEWTDYKKAPMIHLFPYWDFTPGQMIDVRYCTNAPRAELFVNGVSMGVKEIDHLHGTELFPTCKVPFVPGCIEAVAYDENGAVIAKDAHYTSGDSAKIVLSANKNSMSADGRDMIFVEIAMEDAAGYPVENAMDYVHVEVTGAAALVGLDNGDSSDYDQYKSTCRKLFNGKLLAMLRATRAAGEIVVKVTPVEASKAQIAAATLILQAEACDSAEGVSCLQHNAEVPFVTGSDNFVCVRKIEIESKNGQAFSPEKTEIEVVARIYPADATDRKLIFSVVDDAGIASNIATLTAPDGKQVKQLCLCEEKGSDGVHAILRAKGDGTFRLRVSTQNGTDKIKQFASLEFTADGLGEAYINPYEFVAGALYTRSKNDVGGFSEKSVASAQEGVSEIAYDGLDFGDFGSDEITLPIFAMTDQPHYLQIWEGMPDDEGSEMLADVVYQMPTEWDVYKPATYKLKRRIKGIKTLCLITKDQRYFIKGFTFTRQNKAFEQLFAGDCDHLYGDTFVRNGDCVEGIGNNVSLEYENMDFGEQGYSKVTICGRTPLTSNTIHVRFTNENGDVNQIVEFPHSEEYTEVTFDLQNVKGAGKVLFVFLPGCNFDFKYFRFE